MSKDKFVFAQLVSFLNDDKFRHIVDNHDDNRYIKNFSYWNQMLVLMFGQLSGRESLRDCSRRSSPRQVLPFGLWQESNPKQPGKSEPEQGLPHLRRVCLLHGGTSS